VTGESSLGIPSHYDKRYRINIALKNRDVEDFIKKGRLAGNVFYIKKGEYLYKFMS
jgi:hypothetical protein